MRMITRLVAPSLLGAALLSTCVLSIGCSRGSDQSAPAGSTGDAPTDPGKPASPVVTVTKPTITATVNPNATAAPIRVIGGTPPATPPGAAATPPAATPPAATPPAATPPAATPPAAAAPTQTTAVTGRGVPPPPGGRPKPGSK